MSSFETPARVDKPVSSIQVPLGGDPPNSKPFQGAGAQSSQGGWGSFEEWMGKENFRKFQQNICTAISQQISHDRQRQKEAAERLKKSETGQDMYS